MHLDQLLTALAVDVQAFAICEVARGWRLVFGRDAAPTLHYILSGSGVLRVGPDLAFAIDQDSIVLLPRMVPHSFETDGSGRELLVDAGFSDAVRGLNRIRAGGEKRAW